MTDYSEGRSTRCKKCDTPFHTADGPMCDCNDPKVFKCEGCDEMFPEQYTDCRDHEIKELREDKAFLKNGWAVKDKRIFDLEKKIVELESCVRYKEGHIEELQAELAANKRTFDEMTQMASDCLERNRV